MENEGYKKYAMKRYKFIKYKLILPKLLNSSSLSAERVFKKYRSKQEILTL